MPPPLKQHFLDENPGKVTGFSTAAIAQANSSRKLLSKLHRRFDFPLEEYDEPRATKEMHRRQWTLVAPRNGPKPNPYYEALSLG